MGAQNGIIGNEYGMDMPVTHVQEEDLTTEKSMAKFSRTTEFKKLKEYIESRIEFFQKCLPDGTPVPLGRPLAEDWRVANSIIGELKAILSSYESAGEAVKDATKRQG